MKTKSTLKKLGLGASAFACLISMGVQVNAASLNSEGNTTVTYDSRNYVPGVDTNGDAADWGVYIPTTINLSADAAGVKNNITIVSTDGYTSDKLTTYYKELSVKAEVKSKEGFKLSGANGNTASYKLQVENQIFDEADSTNTLEITQKLGVTESSQDVVTSLTLTSTLLNPTLVVEDQYTDELTFTFTEVKADVQ